MRKPLLTGSPLGTLFSSASKIAQAVALAAAGMLCTASSPAQQPRPRITSSIDTTSRATIPGSHPNAARSENEGGRMTSSAKLQGVSIVFSRSAAQEADLQALIAAQQNPSSPLYHKWLTPDQFAARFGMADADIAKVQSWLQQQGFAVDRVSRSRNRISFSGSVAQVEAAFGTELHYYKSGTETHFAPASDVSVPAALAGTVQTVTNLSDFRPKPHVKIRQPQVQPRFTSSQSGNYYLTPKDVATIYDINAAYHAGFTGAGQSIAIVGQSFVETSDITNFQSAAGLTPKAPTLVLMPGTGASAVSSGDEVESDLDLEYASSIATGANIYFVYTGNSGNAGVFDALGYAIDNKIAPILSISYGDCETDLGSSDYNSLNSVFAQATAQGQTIISAAGDDGSADCAENTNLTTAQRTALAVDFPASSQYVTGMGGTEFPASAVATTNNTYFSAQGSSDTISSALKYIPEQVWNDSSPANATSTGNGLSSGGGGVSTLTSRPSWQAGIAGIPSGTARLVPDISLDASPANAGYLYCSSDTNATGVTGSCSNGFRDSSNTSLTVAGGTSFDAPIFAGMLAIINQSKNSSGQGLINPTLYTLAASSSTYATAFHDITSGSNACAPGATYDLPTTPASTLTCTAAGSAGYSAGTGYDEASGLGSIDLYNLLTAWPTSSASTLAASTTTLSAATTTPASGASDTITITVAPGSSTQATVPTGTVSITVDGTAASSSPTLSNGTATYTFSSTTAGSHVIAATYSGDSIYAGSTSTIDLIVGASFSLAATNVTVTSGGTGTSTVTVTPSGGYTGTVNWQVSTSSTALANACAAINSVSVTGTAQVTAALTLSTSATCASASAVGSTGKVKRVLLTGSLQSPADVPGSSPYKSAPLGVALAGLLAFGFLRRRSSRTGWSLLTICLLGVLALSLSGCGSSTPVSTSTTTSTNIAAGTYPVTVTGTDSANAAITASATLTLTVN
ncbi:peptidase S53 [Granulicella sp. WH15]|uniref:protease pro-enzyme activation domain-containing protein n=1 Tax=Granulicella sp. WH15 TaxID=2602070 RepID=UPI00136744DA|nr:protease pro-enzyme activation domain-containing protein [Granulicella sp. WH15]QHN03261.1 peptidase S53 [Granulicella sp. WH15]